MERLDALTVDAVQAYENRCRAVLGKSLSYLHRF
ncbi:hypothetical protein IMCC3135_02465 [Granulosicoccus antarcticus IMCC3135]|uniref:Uncharacterized protein n=1 Tax=Granulosicoccus antarcticus IMCC3135 TaxID=1192854 RepID=A0A2Z2NH39_9GAMM|nr:hypothetical protein IMCC3135_02465 [Granulosicoccus antarcticus IMCC3135]